MYEPATSPITPYLQEDAAYQPLASPATMDQYLSRDGVLLLGDVMALPGLSSPRSPVPVVEEVTPESSVSSPDRNACCSVIRWDAGLVAGGPLRCAAGCVGVGGGGGHSSGVEQSAGVPVLYDFAL